MNTAHTETAAPKNLDAARAALANVEAAYLEGNASYDVVVAAREATAALEAARAEEERRALARASEERDKERRAAAERAEEEERAAKAAREAIPRRRLSELRDANPSPASRVPCLSGGVGGDLLERAAKAAAAFVKLEAEAAENLRAWREREKEIAAILTDLGESDRASFRGTNYPGFAGDLDRLLAGVHLAFASTSWADFSRRCRAQEAPFTTAEILTIARAVSSKATGVAIAPREPNTKEAAELTAARATLERATEARANVGFTGRVPRSKEEREDAQKIERQRERAQIDLDAALATHAEVVGRLEAANVAIE